MYYRDVRIEENVIVNGHTHGITVGAATGVVIRNNTLLRNPNAARGSDRARNVRVPRIRVSDLSRDVAVTDNLAVAFPVAQDGWQVTGNLAVQDISMAQPGYYDTLFRNAVRGDPRQIESFFYLPGGEAGRRGLGARLLQPGADRSRFRGAAGNLP
jgi:hypothetical protein